MDPPDAKCLRVLHQVHAASECPARSLQRRPAGRNPIARLYRAFAGKCKRSPPQNNSRSRTFDKQALFSAMQVRLPAFFWNLITPIVLFLTLAAIGGSSCKKQELLG